MITESDLSPDQKEVFDSIIKWVNNKSSKLLTVGGYAGVGKTSVLSVVAKKLNISIAFCAYTAKAASVLRKKLDDQKVCYDYCGTIHGLIYRPIIDEKTKTIKHWMRNPYLDYDLIVVDEASMVSSSIFNDLRKYEKKILAIGDHAQLPPINSFMNLMEDPNLKLTKIHRQAENNPIIKYSMLIRNGEDTSKFEASLLEDDRIKFIKKTDSALGDFIVDSFSKEKRKDSCALCFYNKTRVRVNKNIRTLLDYNEEDPQVGDVVICLKNDDVVFNGFRGEVSYISNRVDHYDSIIKIYDEDINVDGLISKYQFNQEKTFGSPLELEPWFSAKDWKKVGLLFDFGYCMTVHKAQGSGFSNVLLFKEGYSGDKDYYRRWFYTAVTRSSDKLVIVK